MSSMWILVPLPLRPGQSYEHHSTLEARSYAFTLKDLAIRGVIPIAGFLTVVTVIFLQLYLG